MSRRRGIGLLLCCVVLLVPRTAKAQANARGLRAERFDVAMTLLADGSVQVRESITFAFSGKTFSIVERELPMSRLDGIIDVRAFLDGAALPEQDTAGVDAWVRIRTGRRALKVTWQFPDTIDRTRVFTLEYRAMGALAIEHGRASLAWIVLPSRHAYPIDEARVEWRVPESAVRVEPTTLDDSRWTSEALSDGWAATRQALTRNETVRLSDAFDASSLATTEPVWQLNAERARELAPAIIVGAMTILVMAAGVMGMTWFRYRRPQRERREAEPADLAACRAAVGTAITGGSVSVGMSQMQAALLELAKRGAIDIGQVHDQPGRFEVRMGSAPQVSPHEQVVPHEHVVPHEQVVIDALWLKMKDGRVELRDAWRQLTRALPAFRRAIQTELQASGHLDADRVSGARGLIVAGGVVLFLGVIGIGVFAVLFGDLGDTPLLVPAVVMISGIGFLIAGGAMSVMSGSGLELSAAWRARRRWLKEFVRQPTDAAAIGNWLPAAAGFGLAAKMLKTGESVMQHDAAALGWLSRVPDPCAALSAIIVTTPRGGHAGGAGGAGAAGGGFSGAR